MVFVPFSSSGRTSAFGHIECPKPVLQAEVRKVLSNVLHETCNAERSATRSYPVKRLRNDLIHAMRLDVATQPTAVYKPCANRGKWRKSALRAVRPEINPVWVYASKLNNGAHYKSRRVCSLITDVVNNGRQAMNVFKDIIRLSIVIWKISKCNFDRLIRRIRTRLLANPVEPGRIPWKSPEALVRFEALTKNPLIRECSIRCARHRVCRHDVGAAAMRLSTRVDVVTESHECKKCIMGRVSLNGLLHRS